jgi:hypothetical protein
MISNITLGNNFGGLTRYLMTGKGARGLTDYLHEPKHAHADGKVRVGWTATRNLISEEPRAIAEEMRQTAKLSSRCKSPTYHVSLAFSADDQPDKQTMLDGVDFVLRHPDIGLAEHQVYMVCHQDTDHPHLHLAINRIHRQTGKAWHNGWDRYRFQRALREFERERGLTRVPSSWDVKRFRALQRQTEAFVKRRLDDLRAMLGWSDKRNASLKEIMREDFEQADSWRDLERRARHHGIFFERKGQGLIITDGKGYAKLSEITSKRHRLKALEDRFEISFADWERRREREDHEKAQAAARERRFIELKEAQNEQRERRREKSNRRNR